MPFALGFKNIECRGGVLFEVLARMIETESDIRIRGEMKYRIATRHASREGRQVEIIATNHFKARVRSGVFQELLLASGKVVPANHFRSRCQQLIHQTAADESGCACDKYRFHSGRGV